MVAILVLLTFLTFVAMVWLVAGARESAREGVSPGEALSAPPPMPALASALAAGASYLHPSHVWVRLAPDGIATVGASDFAENFVGALSRVEAPEEGIELRQGEPAWTLVSGKNRKLVQAMPLDGRIVAVNRAMAERRGEGTQSRKGEWILRVRPSRLAENLQNLLVGPLADAWQEAAGVRLNAALAPALGRVANDGGVWLEDFGDMLSDADWTELRGSLFPPQPAERIR